MREVLEREDKWDVDELFEMPRLDDVVTGAEVEHDSVDLSSEYYDTPERDLQAHGVLLRHRTGDDDTGWQLKIPADDGRAELHWPSTEVLPDSVKALLKGITLGKELSGVATIHTVRNRYRIRMPGSVTATRRSTTTACVRGLTNVCWRGARSRSNWGLVRRRFPNASPSGWRLAALALRAIRPSSPTSCRRFRQRRLLAGGKGVASVCEHSDRPDRGG